MLVSPFLLLIGWTNLFSLLFLFLNYYVIIFTWLKISTSIKGLFLRVGFLKTSQRELFFLWVFFISASFFYLFVCVNIISVHWSWNLSPGVFVNFLWAIFKREIQIWFPRRFVEGCDEGAGWVFILVHINWLLYLI